MEIKMKPTKKQIARAKSILKTAGYIINLFHKIDIRDLAEDISATLTDAEVDAVAERLENADANLGVNWESIEIFIDQVVAERSA